MAIGNYDEWAEDKWEEPDYEPAPECDDPECPGHFMLVVENNYGADRDGNRGIRMEWSECDVCGKGPDED